MLTKLVHTSSQTCHDEGDAGKFELTVNMAKKMLPHQGADIDAIEAEYRSKWEASSDIALAKKIIKRSPPPPSEERLESEEHPSRT